MNRKTFGASFLYWVGFTMHRCMPNSPPRHCSFFKILNLPITYLFITNCKRPFLPNFSGQHWPRWKFTVRKRKTLPKQTQPQLVFELRPLPRIPNYLNCQDQHPASLKQTPNQDLHQPLVILWHYFFYKFFLYFCTNRFIGMKIRYKLNNKGIIAIPVFWVKTKTLNLLINVSFIPYFCLLVFWSL